MSKDYKKFAQGLLIVKSHNSLFNSDFSGLPRRLPDDKGTIYATDKALKYCIRKYLHDKQEKIFVWRRYKEDSKPCNIDENYEQCFDSKAKNDKKQKVISNLLSAIDVRLFGATYAGDTNVSLTGNIQISYGVNKFEQNVFFNNQILSPYANKSKSDAEQQTLGDETKTLEAHYVYDFVVNPNNLISSLEFSKEKKNSLLQESDVELFKESMCRGIGSVTSASKIGSDSELFLFVEMKSDEENGKINSQLIPLMKDLIEITKEDKKIVINLTDIFKAFKGRYEEYISSVELYYDDSTTELKGIEGFPVKKRHIVTLEDI